MPSGLLLTDGTSDRPLAEHLSTLCARDGWFVDVVAFPFERIGEQGHSAEARLRAAMRQTPSPDVIFVHRDAEAQGPAVRREEIERAIRAVALAEPVVPVIPVRMTEAWLIVDEAAIRRVARNPRGTMTLDLPRLDQVEAHRDPKGVLQHALSVASGLHGRRLTAFRKKFNEHRRQLIQELDLDGPVTALGAWRALVADIHGVSTAHR